MRVPIFVCTLVSTAIANYYFKNKYHTRRERFVTCTGRTIFRAVKRYQFSTFRETFLFIVADNWEWLANRLFFFFIFYDVKERKLREKSEKIKKGKIDIEKSTCNKWGMIFGRIYRRHCRVTLVYSLAPCVLVRLRAKRTSHELGLTLCVR